MPPDPLDRDLQAFAAPAPILGAEEALTQPADRVDSAYALSGWWRRVGAIVLDDLVLLVPIILLALALHQVQKVHYVNSQGYYGTEYTTHARWTDVVLAFVYSFVLLVRHGRHNGQTLGKQAEGIRIMRNDGEPVDAWTVLVREGIGKALLVSPIIFVVPSLFLLLAVYWLADYLWPLVDSENRALHDLLARTHVVRQDVEPTYFTPSGIATS